MSRKRHPRATRILEAVAKNGAMSAEQIAKIFNKRPDEKIDGHTVTGIISNLVRDGLLQAVGTVKVNRRGRPPAIYYLTDHGDTYLCLYRKENAAVRIVQKPEQKKPEPKPEPKSEQKKAEQAPPPPAPTTVRPTGSIPAPTSLDKVKPLKTFGHTEDPLVFTEDRPPAVIPAPAVEPPKMPVPPPVGKPAGVGKPAQAPKPEPVKAPEPTPTVDTVAKAQETVIAIPAPAPVATAPEAPPAEEREILASVPISRGFPREMPLETRLDLLADRLSRLEARLDRRVENLEQDLDAVRESFVAVASGINLGLKRGAR